MSSSSSSQEPEFHGNNFLVENVTRKLATFKSYRHAKMDWRVAIMSAKSCWKRLKMQRWYVVRYIGTIRSLNWNFFNDFLVFHLFLWINYSFNIYSARRRAVCFASEFFFFLKVALKQTISDLLDRVSCLFNQALVFVSIQNSFSDSSRDVAMATNYEKNKELPFISHAGIWKWTGISQCLF